MIIKTDQNEIQNFLADASNFKGNCDAVYFPDNADEIQSIVIEANKNKTPVTIAGNGTGLTGARVPKGGVVISTERLNKILEINEEKKYAILQPAVILNDFQKILKEKKLFYPPDPTEGNSFIGANVATNASGAKTFKYGPTRDYVLEIKLILPNGELLNLKRGNVFAKDYKLELTTESKNKIEILIPDFIMPETKHAAGYYCKKNMDAVDLFIGSEGTLGIIYEIKFKLLDFPEAILSSVVFFKTELETLKFIEEARQLSRNNESEINALALEYFDHHSLKFMSEDYPQIPASAKAAVWFEQDYNSGNENIIFESWMNLIYKY
ncbi:MAG: FAD-binding oxidoreductase, partial [Melioribacteraceae bacterium]